MKLITMGDDNFIIEMPFDKGLMFDVNYDDDDNLFGFRYSNTPLTTAFGFPVDDCFMAAELTDKDVYTDGTAFIGDNPKGKRFETDQGLIEFKVSLSPEEKIELLAHLLMVKLER